MRALTTLLVAGLVLGSSGMALAADNATATATAVVITPISITKNTDMTIGNLVPGNGTVTLSTSGARTKTGTVALSTSGSTPAAAVFTVGGEGSNTFAITYTDSSTTLSDGSTNTMAVTWITEAVSGTGSATGVTTGQASTGTLSSGAAKIYGGAAVVVDNAQASGTYTGDLKVTVAYN